MLPVLAELGITLVAHSPTGHGALHRPPPSALGTALAEIALARQVTPGQVALAWVHHQHRPAQPVVPLPGTTRASHLHANLAAASLTLDNGELERLTAASSAN
jgi:aryl-alcohol dehydrogenase-like predicted oxidoreductase